MTALKYSISVLLLFIYLSANAQFAWIDPAVPDVTDSLTVFVDLSQDPNCDKLVGSPGPIFIWTWGPNDPVDGNGMWGTSAPEQEMVHRPDIGADVWSYTMLPIDYYGAAAEDIYENGLDFLAKEANGGQGGDCSSAGDEFKTSDIHIDVPAPFVLEKKVYSFPDFGDGDTLYTHIDDVFTLYYKNYLEEKVTMQNLTEVWVYARALGDDGSSHIITPPSQIGTNPNLKMVDQGNGLFTLTIIPEEYFAPALPGNVKLERMRFQIVSLVNGVICGSDCQVDGDFYFGFKCD